jgi:hypothetical protein
MISETIELDISAREIRRRKQAYTALNIFLVLGMIIPAFDLVITHTMPALIVIFIVAAFLYLIRIFMFRAIDNFSRTKYLIDSRTVTTITAKSRDVYDLQDLRRIYIKRKSDGIIRVIKITKQSGESLAINGLDNPENVKELILKNTESTAEIKEFKEPLDYDHKLFYPILGLLTGSLMVLFIRFFSGMSESGLYILYWVIIGINLIISLVLLMSQPISQSYGQRTRVIDYAIGLGILVLDIFLALYLFVWQ